ncbi:MAG: HD domain-containing protein [Oligoflexia bacterium]|nr:HD domain-containing protein [Oligoflexia bacterium]
MTLGTKIGANLWIVLPSAWLHDLVTVPKNDPNRSQASRLSAKAARKLLEEWQYPAEFLDGICHCIEAHSFSAGIEPTTIEAQVVQDADRLDGLGAIGVARCFATAGIIKRPFYDVEDPFCRQRPPDDGVYTVDHFYKKLFVVAQSLKTEPGKHEGQRRLKVMKEYLAHLELELGSADGIINAKPSVPPNQGLHEAFE